MVGRSFNSIQYLRGVAAMMVVAYHLGEPLAHLGYRGTWPTGLSAGVDIFFVISGFVMWISTIDRPVTPLQFLKKRIIRIVPLYWLLTTFMVLVLLLMPSVVRTAVLHWPHTMASYLFLPVLNPGKPAMEPLLFPGWTLNYEMFFYAIFSLFLLTSPRWRLGATVGTLLALVILGVVAPIDRLSAGGFYTSPILLEFAAGMIIGVLVHAGGTRRLLPPAAAICAIAIGFGFILFSPLPPAWPWALCFGLPAAAIILGAVSLEARGLVGEWKFLHVIGDASYSIYLTQLISMAAFRQAWMHLAPPAIYGSLLLYAIINLIVAAAVGLICFHLVERPMTALLTRHRGAANRSLAQA